MPFFFMFAQPCNAQKRGEKKKRKENVYNKNFLKIRGGGSV